MDTPDCAGLPAPTVGRSAGAIFHVLHSRPGLVVKDAHAAALGGLKGYRLDLRLAKGWKQHGCTGEPDVPLLVGVPPSDFVNTILGRVAIRLYLLDRNGGTLSVEVDDVSGGSRLASYQPVIDSLSVRRLTADDQPSSAAPSTQTAVTPSRSRRRKVGRRRTVQPATSRPASRQRATVPASRACHSIAIPRHPISVASSIVAGSAFLVLSQSAHVRRPAGHPPQGDRVERRDDRALEARAAAADERLEGGSGRHDLQLDVEERAPRDLLEHRLERRDARRLELVRRQVRDPAIDAVDTLQRVIVVAHCHVIT